LLFKRFYIYVINRMTYSSGVNDSILFGTWETFRVSCLPCAPVTTRQPNIFGALFSFKTVTAVHILTIKENKGEILRGISQRVYSSEKYCASRRKGKFWDGV